MDTTYADQTFCKPKKCFDDQQEVDLIRYFKKIEDGSIWYHTEEVRLRAACGLFAALLVSKNQDISAGKTAAFTAGYQAGRKSTRCG